jgi:ribosylpyrimidine nucleosidase
MIQRKVIMDVDPGHDDAVAMLVINKIPSLKVLGFTVVSGNSSIEQTVMNARKVCSHLGIDTPIYAGMSMPMVRDRFLSSHSVGDVHGITGLDGPVFGEPSVKVQKTHAVQFIIETLLGANEKITLCASGPLSNLGMALRLEPDIRNNVAEIVLMGGAYGSGNVTPSAEFNILADPEAAHIVFSSGVPVTMIGLDATRQTLAYKERVQYIRELDNVGSRLFCDLIDFFTDSQKKAFGWNAPPIHDVLNVAYLADPGVLSFLECAVKVDTVPGLNYGRTVCDLNHVWKDMPIIKVADVLDKDAFWEIIRTAIARYPKN